MASMARECTLQTVPGSAARRGLLAALAALWLLMAGRPATAAPANTLTVGDLSATVSTYDGLFAGTGLMLTFRGRPIISRSAVSIAAPDWSQGYFTLSRVRPRVEQATIPGGKRLALHVANDVVEMTYTVDLLEGNRAVLDLQGTLRKEAPAILEYNAGCLSSVVLAGEPYQADTTEGAREGRIPFWSSGTSPKAAMVLPPLRRLQIASRLGTLRIAVAGDAPGLDFYDARMVPQSWLQERPVFWLGYLAAPIQTGRPFHSRIELQITATDAVPAPAPPAATPKALPVRDVPALRQPAEDDETRVIPAPREWRPGRGTFVLNGETRILFAADAGSRRAARELRDRLRAEFGVRVPTAAATAGHDRRNAILIGTLGSAPTRKWLAAAGAEPVRQAEGYLLRAAPGSVLIAGADARGALYGVFTLLQMLQRDNAATPAASLRLPAAVIRDWPALPVRGVHLLTDHWSTFLHRDLIRNVLAPHKINTILLECEYVKWDRHPELHMPWGMEKEEVRALLALARDYHIEVIPLVQTLGHVGWMFRNNQHLDLAEDPQAKYAYCPSNPRSYELVFDVFDEALALFDNPRYFHIGHDEFTHRGKFAQEGPCKGRRVADLFVEDTIKLRDYLAARGARTLMWGDMLLGPGEGRDATHAKSQAEAEELRARLPKDILITDWHYVPAPDYPSLRLFRQAGFETWAATWQNPRNVHGFAQAAATHATGLIQTTWTGYNGNITAIRREFPQFWAYLLAAEYAWSPDAPPLDEVTATMPRRFVRAWPALPHPSGEQAGFTVDLTPLAQLPWQDTPRRDGWLGYGPTYDLSALPSGEQRLGDTLFLLPETRKAVALAAPLLPARYPESMTIPVGRTAAELTFLLATGWETAEGETVGQLVVCYADGTQMPVPLRYGWNIRAVRDPRLAFQAPVVWEGKTAGGDSLYLRAHTVRNPLPTKEVAAVQVTAGGGDAAPLVLALSGTQTAPARSPGGR